MLPLGQYSVDHDITHDQRYTRALKRREGVRKIFWLYQYDGLVINCTARPRR